MSRFFDSSKNEELLLLNAESPMKATRAKQKITAILFTNREVSPGFIIVRR
jgi:hypothetical protein